MIRIFIFLIAVLAVLFLVFVLPAVTELCMGGFEEGKND